MKSNLINPLQTGTIGVALLALAAATARADVEDTITKSLKIQPGGQLVVGADRGSIEVKTADGGSLNVEVTRKAGGSQARAEKILRNHAVTISQDGNKVEVRAEYKGDKLTGWFGNGPDLQVKYTITIPCKFDVDLRTSGGSIQVADLTGNVQAQTSGGSLNFAKIAGPLSGHTSGGSITVAGCKGNADLRTSGGSLHLSNIEGDVDARTSGGSIHADKLTGTSVLKTSGGSIQVSEIKGQVEAGTSGGSITANLLAQPTGDCTFRTSGGSITVVLGEKVAVDIDARTSGGRVSSDLPVATVVQGEQAKNELSGKINGGGPLITAHTSGGGVRILKK
jgi:DUF4097 and DUF4098 domain-containing protein YvlB